MGFFVSQASRENSVAALIWLGQEPQLDDFSDWTELKKIRFISSLPVHGNVPFILVLLFDSSFSWYCYFLCVPSLSHSFGKNSSWIVFLEEETNVEMTKLVQVLAKFDKNKVSVCEYSLYSSISCRLPLLPCLSLSDSSARPEASCLGLRPSWSSLQLGDMVSGWLQLVCSCTELCQLTVKPVRHVTPISAVDLI